MDPEPPKTVEELNQKLETRLIAQEHRLFWIIRNLWWHQRRPLGDPYGDAAREAVIFRLALALLPTTAAAGVGLTALLGLALAWKANDFIKQQNYLIESQRRSTLVYELSSILDEIDEEMDQHDSKTNKISRPFEMTPLLQGRIIALSRSLRPYRYLNDAGTLIPKALSPERGQLFLSLVESEVNVSEILTKGDFTSCDLNGVQLDDAIITKVDMNGSDFTAAQFFSVIIENGTFRDCVFRKAHLHDVTLIGVDLANADFRDAILASVAFMTKQPARQSAAGFQSPYSLLPPAKMFAGADCSSLSLEGALVIGEQWLSDLSKVTPPVRNFNAADWELDLSHPVTIMESVDKRAAQKAYYVVKVPKSKSSI